MKGFKDSTKTTYSMGGYAKGGPKGAAKVSKVMGEFKAGTLHSGSKKGPEVSNPKQAVAIALSEARKAGANIPMKKAEGGAVSPFGKAFREARASGASTFMWNGKKYTTELAAPKPSGSDVQYHKPSALTKETYANEGKAKPAPAPAPQPTLKDAFARVGAADAARNAAQDAARETRVRAMEAAAEARKRAAPSTLKEAFARVGAADAARNAAEDAARERRLQTPPPRTLKEAFDVVGAADARRNAAQDANAYRKGGPVKRTKAVPVAPKGPMIGAKKEMGGMASSIRTNPDLNMQDRRFVEDRAAQMRNVVGKPMKKGGRSC